MFYKSSVNDMLLSFRKKNKIYLAKVGIENRQYKVSEAIQPACINLGIGNTCQERAQ